MGHDDGGYDNGKDACAFDEIMEAPQPHVNSSAPAILAFDEIWEPQQPHVNSSASVLVATDAESQSARDADSQSSSNYGGNSCNSTPATLLKCKLMRATKEIKKLQETTCTERGDVMIQVHTKGRVTARGDSGRPPPQASTDKIILSRLAAG